MYCTPLLYRRLLSLNLLIFILPLDFGLELGPPLLQRLRLLRRQHRPDASEARGVRVQGHGHLGRGLERSYVIVLCVKTSRVQQLLR